MRNQESVTNRLAGNSYKVRHETFMGEDYLVVPVVMLVEGVHNGSGGRMLHTPEELAKVPDGWDGRPVCVDHPQRNDQMASCNSPEFIESITIGMLFNTEFDGRLVSEAWLSKSKLRQICPEILFAVQKGSELEVSTGYFSEKEMKQGTWNGEAYEGIEHNYIPDHLAILTQHEGACSLADGCGLGVNETEEGGGNLDAKWSELVKGIAKSGYSVLRMTACEKGYGEVMESIQLKLNALDEADKAYYLVDVYKDHFVYEVRTMGSSALYKRSYTATDNVVEFTGEPAKVSRKVEYVVQQEASKKGGEKKKMERGKKTCEGCPEVIAALIANEATKWKAEDEDKLTALGDDLGKEFLENMLPVEIVGTLLVAETTPAVDEEQALEVLRGQLSDPKKFLALLGSEAKGAMERGIALHKEERAVLIANITTNAGDNGYTEADLSKKDTPELQKLSALAKNHDYSGLSGGGGTVKGEGGVKPMTRVGVKAK